MRRLSDNEMDGFVATIEARMGVGDRLEISRDDASQRDMVDALKVASLRLRLYHRDLVVLFPLGYPNIVIRRVKDAMSTLLRSGDQF